MIPQISKALEKGFKPKQIIDYIIKKIFKNLIVAIQWLKPKGRTMKGEIGRITAISKS